MVRIACFFLIFFLTRRVLGESDLWIGGQEVFFILGGDICIFELQLVGFVWDWGYRWEREGEVVMREMRRTLCSDVRM